MILEMYMAVNLADKKKCEGFDCPYRYYYYNTEVGCLLRYSNFTALNNIE